MEEKFISTSLIKSEKKSKIFFTYSIKNY